MRHFDLHCDTLSRCRNLKESLLHSEGAISVDRGLIFDQITSLELGQTTVEQAVEDVKTQAQLNIDDIIME